MKTEMKSKEDKKYIFKRGKRKTSNARVMLFLGKGDNLVNGKPIDVYFPKINAEYKINQPFKSTDTEGKYYFTAKIQGGGINGQVSALVLALSRALSTISEDNRKILRKEGLLTCDSRVVERKKIGHRKARKSPQFSKR